MKSFGNTTRTITDEITGINELLQYIHVDIDTGVCTWKNKQKYSKVVIGSIAGSDNKGYRQIEFNDSSYKVHRIVFYVAKGYLPLIVDHIKGVEHGNGIGNLQESTNQQNLFKKKLHSNNKSGYRGVSWDKARNKWLSQIQIDGKFKKLGRFDTPEEASVAYENAAKIAFGDFYRGNS